MAIFAFVGDFVGNFIARKLGISTKFATKLPTKVCRETLLRQPQLGCPYHSKIREEVQRTTFAVIFIRLKAAAHETHVSSVSGYFEMQPLMAFSQLPWITFGSQERVVRRVQQQGRTPDGAQEEARAASSPVIFRIAETM